MWRGNVAAHQRLKTEAEVERQKRGDDRHAHAIHNMAEDVRRGNFEAGILKLFDGVLFSDRSYENETHEKPVHKTQDRALHRGYFGRSLMREKPIWTAICSRWRARD